MNPKLKAFLLIVLYLAIGLAVMGAAGLLRLPAWLPPALVVLFLFVMANIITAKILGLQKEIRTFWSLQKLHFLLIGILAGALIAGIPALAGVLAGRITIAELCLSAPLSPSSAALTLAIVAWEELWFRGIFLNYCRRSLSAVFISILTGLLFMLVHALNPEINLLQTGPVLFFAGALLTLVYFYFKTIWLPIGLHFGNNYLALHTKLDNDWLLGNDGYLGAIVLAVLFLAYAKAATKTYTGTTV